MSCILAGHAESRKLAERTLLLEKFLKFLANVEAEVRYSAMPVDKVVEKYGGELPFLQLCTEYCRKGMGFQEAWECGLRDAGEGIREEDRELFRGFGKGFGASDLQGQASHCELYRKITETRLKEAEQEKNSKAKLYLSLGVSGGLCAVLILW